jgi:inner membrane transporter RhtA
MAPRTAPGLERPAAFSGAAADVPGPPPGRLGGVALMVGSALANQAGASAGALAFPVIGPLGVVAIRQWVAATVLLATARPKMGRFTAAQWRPVLGLALVYAVMNLSLYTAIDRVGLGLAVTLEFLGPLSVALIGSRRRLDAACALVAGAAVVVLIHPAGTTDYLGIGVGLLAAVCWGCYILLNRTIGGRLPGLEGSAAAATISAVAYVPAGVLWLCWHRPTLAALAGALAAGVLSSAVPLLCDLLALRRVPAQFFGVFMSVNPVFAALAGLIVLNQHLGLAAWLAIAVIVAVNAVVVSTQPAGPEPRLRGPARCRYACRDGLSGSVRRPGRPACLLASGRLRQRDRRPPRARRPAR